MPISSLELHQLYLAYFGRPPDHGGHSYYVGDPAWTIQSAAGGFSASAESQALFGTVVDEEMIHKIYRNLFNRDAEPAGLNYWLGEVQSGRLTPAFAAYGILVGAQNDDAKAVANKLEAGAAFFAAMDGDGERSGYAGPEAIAVAREFLAQVGHDRQTIDTALADIPYEVASATDTLPPDLTEGADNLAGSSKIDAFHAVIGGDEATLQAGDRIDGRAGDDILFYSITHEAGQALPDAEFRSIETIYVINHAQQARSVDARIFEDATVLYLVAAEDAATITHLAEGQAAGIGGTDDIVTSADLSFVWDAAVDAAELRIGDQSNQSVSVGGAAVETTRLIAYGNEGLFEFEELTLTGAANRTLNLEGAEEWSFAQLHAQGELSIDSNTAYTIGSLEGVTGLATSGSGDVDITLGALEIDRLTIDLSETTGTVRIDASDLLVGGDDELSITGSATESTVFYDSKGAEFIHGGTASDHVFFQGGVNSQFTLGEAGDVFEFTGAVGSQAMGAAGALLNISADHSRLGSGAAQGAAFAASHFNTASADSIRNVRWNDDFTSTAGTRFTIDTGIAASGVTVIDAGGDTLLFGTTEVGANGDFLVLRDRDAKTAYIFQDGDDDNRTIDVADMLLIQVVGTGTFTEGAWDLDVNGRLFFQVVPQ